MRCLYGPVRARERSAFACSTDSESDIAAPLTGCASAATMTSLPLCIACFVLVE